LNRWRGNIKQPEHSSPPIVLFLIFHIKYRLFYVNNIKLKRKKKPQQIEPRYLLHYKHPLPKRQKANKKLEKKGQIGFTFWAPFGGVPLFPSCVFTSPPPSTTSTMKGIAVLVLLVLLSLVSASRLLPATTRMFVNKGGISVPVKPTSDDKTCTDCVRISAFIFCYLIYIINSVMKYVNKKILLLFRC
jgi:hypothetical protein